MSTDPIRLWGASVSFDETKEADIIECVREMSKSHKLGRFMAHLLRLAFESPEVFGNGKEVLSIVDKMSECNLTPTRHAYFNQVNKDVEAMKKKVDDIYDIAYKTYMLAQMGKRIGLEEKSKNLLRSTFLLERQTSELCDKLGINDLNHTFASNKLMDTEEKAKDVLEVLITSYEDIIDEIRTSVTVDVGVPGVQVMNTVPVNTRNEASKPMLINTYRDNNDDKESYVDLTEKPKNKRVTTGSTIDTIVIEKPSIEDAQNIMTMLAGLD